MFDDLIKKKKKLVIPVPSKKLPKLIPVITESGELGFKTEGEIKNANKDM